MSPNNFGSLIFPGWSTATTALTGAAVPHPWYEGGLTQIFWNVVGGVIVALMFEIIPWAKKKFKKRAFRAIFGEDIGSRQFHLIYAQFILKNLTPPDPAPYRKPTNPIWIFSISHPVSLCEVRAAKYLTGSIAAQDLLSPILTADEDITSTLDVSFVSFGGPGSNLKSNDLNNCQNALIDFGNNNFISTATGSPVISFAPGFDYGIIIKVHPPSFPDRTWITCAGLSEWGTSGAAWYLANRWEEIHRYAGDAPFAIIVRVRHGQDESAEPIYRTR